MIFAPKEIILKNGKKAILRNVTPEDAQEILKFYKQIAGETFFMMRYPEECDLMDVEGEQERLKAKQDSKDNLFLCCETEGKIVGDCGLSRQCHIKTRHRGSVGIGILKEYWNMGIGTALFEEIIKAGKEMGLCQLELGVFEGNERGMSLYRKMGFSQVAELPNAVRLKDGTMLKEYTMIRDINHDRRRRV